MKVICKDVKDTLALGKQLGNHLKSGDVVSLRGNLGAGKTVLAKGIALSLDITEPIVSPTFTLVQEYDGKMKMFHIDLYRISGDEEFEMMGGEEFLYSSGICLIEWSEKIQDMLPKNTIYVNITINKDQSREIEIKGVDF